jgi:hypothetical protein
VSTDDLLTPIPLDALRTSIPTDDIPFRIQKENSVILDAGDEGVKMHFGLLQSDVQIVAIGDFRCGQLLTHDSSF